jgi:Domain of unknown function (DUF4157)
MQRASQRSPGTTPDSPEPQRVRTDAPDRSRMAERFTGNQAALRQLSRTSPLASPPGSPPGSPLVQCKLQVGSSNDPLEAEADRVADRVTRMANPAAHTTPSIRRVSRKCASCSEEEEQKTLRTKPAGSITPGEAPPIVHQALRSSGQPLDTATRSFVEPRFRRDFSGVRVHTGADAAQSAQAVNAVAYTVGSDIVFGQGKFAPVTPAGQRLLAHELAHVVQQSDGGSLVQRAENDTIPDCGKVADSQTDVDTKVNDSLDAARKASGAPPKAADVAKGVFKDLATNTSLGRSAIEDWASSLPATKQVLPAQKDTKYAGVNYGLWRQKMFPILNPTMKINDICVGSDKLGHFFQQGATFFETESLQGTAAAEKESQLSESGGFGLQTTGVFSNADREANRQGGKFYHDLMAAPTMKFGIASYISSAWSEVDHPNFYQQDVGHQVWANTLTGDWAGNSTPTPPATAEALTLKLSATTAGAVTGTFTVGAASGTLTGTIQYQTTSVPDKDMIGRDTTANPISGVHIDFDWKMGSSAGKGVFNSGGERHLGGSWGNGASTTDRGMWIVDHS